MRGFFGVGIEGISKEMNAGSIFRSAHAFGGSFVFTVNAQYSRHMVNRSDTSASSAHVPFYAFPDMDQMMLPHGCDLVGIELTDDAVDLPSFHHPSRAAYILGPERGSLSPEMVKKCRFVIKIPTRFCVNVGVAAAIVMYDRIKSLGNFQNRPVTPGGPMKEKSDHVYGQPKFRNGIENYQQEAPHYSEEKPVKG